MWLLPLADEKLAVWGTTNSQVPVDRLRGGISPASDFLDNFKVLLLADLLRLTAFILCIAS